MACAYSMPSDRDESGFELCGRDYPHQHVYEWRASGETWWIQAVDSQVSEF